MERERERERQIDRYIYIYIYREREIDIHICGRVQAYNVTLPGQLPITMERLENREAAGKTVLPS